MLSLCVSAGAGNRLVKKRNLDEAACLTAHGVVDQLHASLWDRVLSNRDPSLGFFHANPPLQAPLPYAEDGVTFPRRGQ
ncbi:MAG: hypothetical protein QOH40_1527 [Arthrobacter pascens]|jgi:hypothetical protein|nr:hypothetical protein [Arthrobacter pascens]